MSTKTKAACCGEPVDGEWHQGHCLGGLTVHYEAYYAAEGGPGWLPPTIDTDKLHDECGAPVTLAFDFDGNRWIIANAAGQIYAEAQNPGLLAPWLSEYTAQLGDMYERGEL